MNLNKEYIETLFYEFVGQRSDSNSSFEEAMEKLEYETIKQLSYFKENEKLKGMYKVEDGSNKKIVWALKRGENLKTIVLFHHHDTVDSDDFDDYKFFAYKPKLLREAYKTSVWPIEVQKDIDSDEWIFGRGTADMKSGMAINHGVFEALCENKVDFKGSVLLVSLPDEENLSIGMRALPKLIEELVETYKIDPILGILTEPHEREDVKQNVVHTGSVGKVTPIILTKGVKCHIGNIFSGINSNLIMSEIIRNVELNIDFSDRYKGMMTPPPSFVFCRDLKEKYDVSTPEYTASYCNILYLKRDLNELFASLKETITWSMEDAINKVNYGYNEYLRKTGEKSYVNCLSFEPHVYTIKEFESKFITCYEKKKVSMDSFKKMIYAKISNDEMTIQQGNIEILKKMATYHVNNQPLVLIGIMPPFYPAYNIEDVGEADKRFIRPLKESMIEKKLFGKTYKSNLKKYFMGISDMSYAQVQNESNYHFFKDNSVIDEKIYHLPLDKFKTHGFPVINMGPWGKDIHKNTERVYKKDVFDNIPQQILSYMMHLQNSEGML